MVLPRYPRLRRGLQELALILTLYVAYTSSRMFASNAMTPALHRANELLHLEELMGLHWERPINKVFEQFELLGLFGSYWYATAHYVVTAVVLIWLYRLGSGRYVPARRALVIATLLALAIYLLAPTAPPRFLEGYVDILNLHAADGWWGADASAPRGVGQLTNELAAFPSLHAGWALWVAIVVQRNAVRPWVRVLGWAHCLVTAVVIVGTGNHWIVDAIVGWMVIGAGFLLADRVWHWEQARKMPQKGHVPEGCSQVG
ncbi:MAG: integral rane protein [Nocardioides sp.]|nr:integral rane protein [Nocardioides sp.]